MASLKRHADLEKQILATSRGDASGGAASAAATAAASTSEVGGRVVVGGRQFLAGRHSIYLLYWCLVLYWCFTGALLALYWYKSTNTDAKGAAAGGKREESLLGAQWSGSAAFLRGDGYDCDRIDGRWALNLLALLVQRHRY